MSLPPFAGVVTRNEAMRDGLRVREATARLHRFAYVKQRLAITAAAFLPSTPEWEVKCALALHGWIDAEHAAAIYGRLAEMREPAPSPGDVPDDVLSSALDEALAAATTESRVGAIYGAVRPALRSAMETYLEETNPLCDQPSVRVLRHALEDERVIDAWSTGARATVDSGESREWQQHVVEWLNAAGGIDGRAAIGIAAGRRYSRPYRFDVLPRRDSRLAGVLDTSTPADIVYLDETRPVGERNAALIFKRLREMDVPEVIAGVAAEHWAEERNAGKKGRPWAYYASMLRQMWDEARHAMLGQALMESHGVDWTSLPVNMTFSWKLAKHCTPVERHILLYAIEQSLMPRDRGKPYEHRVSSESGDRLSALFHDYDWADEVLHVEIARRCLRPDLPGGLAEARERSDELWTRITAALERDPPPAERPAAADWWRRFVRQVTGRESMPLGETHVKDWRPE